MTSPAPDATPQPRPTIDTADIGLTLLALSQSPAAAADLDVLLGERTVENLQSHLIVAVAMIKQLTVVAARKGGETEADVVASLRRSLLGLQANTGSDS